MKKLIVNALFAATLAPVAGHAAYPDRPISLVVPYAPGGTADALARVIAQHLGKKLDQTVVVENRSGASGIIGQTYVARAKADGYTLLYDATPLTINPAVNKLNFDPSADLKPLTMVSVTPGILVVPKSSELNSVQDVVEKAKAAPGSLTFASGGTGTLQFMAGELFRQNWKIDMLHVPFKSGGPAIMATVGAQVDMMFPNISSTLPMVKSDQLKVLAITSAKRNELLPDVPTVAESGLPGYEIFEWNGVFVPKDTPQTIADKLEKTIHAVMKEPEVQEKFASLGVQVKTSSQSEFRKFLDAEFAKWADVVSKSNIKK
ncbi:Bug family tripartite tricarboxylate transporter substrate binding protein [Advenella mimigardefordensis]|uniref:Putative Bug-like extracytoplasmic solute binding receptor, TTT family n=1 Tax=Advenella mimigardefordensis (strain DSM 17166 / LMG 22922 / DPN7) TaxID=1247726 RepID=W0P9G4_ADVMD|nr:tripartite tricarboxylate transporter substrate binding protein [Advenella mimigardefordensis]AHG62132.1 putative Bug-like extracytoplasmic solute binding receptor, TTT family [Advenella mimigardefordensis DPN7]